MSSRYTMKGEAPFGEIAFGWDDRLEGFYFQCFHRTENDDEGPAVWLPRLSLDELALSFARLGAALPDLARRALLAEQHDGPMDFAVGDPVIARLANGKIQRGKVTKLLEAHEVRVRYSNRTAKHAAAALEPDLQRVGVL